MNNIAITVSLIAGISTGIGALPIYFKRDISKPMLDLGMGFSSGIMLVAAFTALLLPSMSAASVIYGPWVGIIPSILGLIIGYQIIIFLHQRLPHQHLIEDYMQKKHKDINRVSLIVLAICLHNIPEGLSVGVGFGGHDLAKGVSLGIAIAIQNMPEGLVVALGLISIGVSKHKAFFMALLSGMIEPIAALFGYLVTQLSQLVLPFALSFAGGAMLFVVCQEMFPELFTKSDQKSAINGLLSGIACMMILDYMLAH